MKHILRGLIFSLVAFSTISSGATVHYMVMELQGRPFQIEENGANQRGIITDLVYEIFRDGPHELITHTFPYLRMRMNMQSGEYPNWLRYGSPVWGPLNENLTDVPVLDAENILLVRKDSGIKFRTIEDLFGHQLILMRGFSYREIDPYLKSGQIGELRVPSFSKAYTALDRGRGVGVSDIKLRMRYNAAWLGLNADDYDVVDFSSVIPNYSIFLNMDPEMDADVQRFINQRLVELKGSGFIDQLIAEYAPNAAAFPFVNP